jgi:phage shock protein PspC (stress-responsive transcriptional regulator)
MTEQPAAGRPEDPADEPTQPVDGPAPADPPPGSAQEDASGFPPPGGFPPPPPGTGGWASRYGLVRPTQGRVLSGVCAAIGRATNTDPVLWRVLFAVLVLVGGVGLLAYVLGWLFIPGEGDTGSPVEALFGRGRSSTSPIMVIIIGILAVVGLGTFFYHGLRSAALLLAVILGAIILISRVNTTPQVPPPVLPVPPMPPMPPGPPAPPMPTVAYAAPAPTVPMPVPMPPVPPTVPPQGYRPPFAPHGPYASRYPYPGLTPPPPPPPKPRRPPSRLGRIVFSTALLLLGALAVIDVAGGADVPGLAYVALALGTVAVGLIAGAWFGRARWLIPIGIVLTLGLGIATAVARIDPHPGRAGDITWVPGTVADIDDRYDASFGDATLDLTEVDFTGAQKNVSVTISAGSLTVLLPPKVDTVVDARVAVGQAHVFDSQWSGIGGPQRQITDNGTDGPGGGTLTLTVRVNAGDLEVRR